MVKCFYWAYEITFMKKRPIFFPKREARCVYERKAKVILSLINRVQVKIL